MQPKAEFVHWMFATGLLMLGLCLLAEAVVGPDVWARRAWRPYVWPGLLFVMGVLMWPVMVFFTNSTIHMLAHGSWAQTMMLAGAAELGLVRGKLHSPYWRLALPLALAVGARMPPPRRLPVLVGTAWGGGRTASFASPAPGTRGSAKASVFAVIIAA